MITDGAYELGIMMKMKTHNPNIQYTPCSVCHSIMTLLSLMMLIIIIIDDDNDHEVT